MIMFGVLAITAVLIITIITSGTQYLHKKIEFTPEDQRIADFVLKHPIASMSLIRNMALWEADNCAVDVPASVEISNISVLKIRKQNILMELLSGGHFGESYYEVRYNASVLSCSAEYIFEWTVSTNMQVLGLKWYDENKIYYALE